MSSGCYTGNFDFKDDSYKTELQWTRTPDKATCSPTGLEVHMSAKSDFWQKTYYNPPLLNDHGHILYKEISNDYIMMETFFDLEAVQQYDQAGLMVRLDTGHWIKAGLEYVDGKYQLGAVVTNEYSDWSVQEYPSGKLGLRMYRQGNDFVIEAKSPSADTWKFIRICHLNVKKDETLKMGLMACAPTDAGGKVAFSHLKFAENKGYHH